MGECLLRRLKKKFKELQIFNHFTIIINKILFRIKEKEILDQQNQSQSIIEIEKEGITEHEKQNPLQISSSRHIGAEIEKNTNGIEEENKSSQDLSLVNKPINTYPLTTIEIPFTHLVLNLDCFEPVELCHHLMNTFFVVLTQLLSKEDPRKRRLTNCRKFLLKS